MAIRDRFATRRQTTDSAQIELGWVRGFAGSLVTESD
jgi:hypothetical protein